jgi:hypothetical protein
MNNNLYCLKKWVRTIQTSFLNMYLICSSTLVYNIILHEDDAILRLGYSCVCCSQTSFCFCYTIFFFYFSIDDTNNFLLMKQQLVLFEKMSSNDSNIIFLNMYLICWSTLLYNIILHEDDACLRSGFSCVCCSQTSFCFCDRIFFFY